MVVFKFLVAEIDLHNVNVRTTTTTTTTTPTRQVTDYTAEVCLDHGSELGLSLVDAFRRHSIHHYREVHHLDVVFIEQIHFIFDKRTNRNDVNDESEYDHSVENDNDPSQIDTRDVELTNLYRFFFASDDDSSIVGVLKALGRVKTGVIIKITLPLPDAFRVEVIQNLLVVGQIAVFVDVFAHGRATFFVCQVTSAKEQHLMSDSE